MKAIGFGDALGSFPSLALAPCRGAVLASGRVATFKKNRRRLVIRMASRAERGGWLVRGPAAAAILKMIGSKK
jgi:hypothetical protein